MATETQPTEVIQNVRIDLGNAHQIGLGTDRGVNGPDVGEAVQGNVGAQRLKDQGYLIYPNPSLIFSPLRKPLSKRGWILGL